MADGAQVAAFVYAPDGVSDAPGTPFGVDVTVPPVLFLHGNGEEHGIFGPIVDAVVAGGRSAVCVDSRGQGRSSRGTARLTYELMAADALEVLSRLGVTQAHVVGFSDGAIEGLLLARDHGPRVLSLTSIGANLTPDGVIDDGWDMAAIADVNASWAAWARRAESSALDAGLLSPRVDEAQATADLMRLMMEEPHIDPASLGSITCPVTVMVGEKDVIEPTETVAIARAIPGARAYVSPGNGHSLPKHAPGEVARMVLATIGRNDLRRPLGGRRLPPGNVVVCHVGSEWADAIDGLYARVVDVPGDTSGWHAGAWPPPGLADSLLAQGSTWCAFDTTDVVDGVPVWGARVLGAVSLDGDTGIDCEGKPDWEDAPGAELGVHLLAVDPAARGRHVAVALLDHAVREAQAQGKRFIRLNTSPENVAANALYQGFGFERHRPLRLPYAGLDISAWTNLWQLEV